MRTGAAFPRTPNPEPLNPGTQASFSARLLRALRDDCGVRKGDRVVVGVSGGVDSVVLLRTLAEAGLDVVAAHAHHGLRDDADADAAFVATLASGLGVPFEEVRLEVPSGNRQASARSARYEALAGVAERTESAAVAVAHTATDQAETLLMHLVRGTGLAGLGGMAPARPIAAGSRLVRPMLWATRAAVEAEATARGWRWREDPSNASDRYLRNRIRHHVLPLLEEEGGPETTARMARTARIVRQMASGLGPEAWLKAAGRADAWGGWVELAALDAVSPDARTGLWAEALRAWAPGASRTTRGLDEIDRLVGAPPGRRVDLHVVSVWREDGHLRFVRSGRPWAEVRRSTTDLPWSVPSPVGTLTAEVIDPLPECGRGGAGTVALDADALGPDLVIRASRAGDTIVPQGFAGSKKIRDVLRQHGVPHSDRGVYPVLCDGDGRVVWVAGLRLAAGVEATPATRRGVRLTWEPAGGIGLRPVA